MTMIFYLFLKNAEGRNKITIKKIVEISNIVYVLPHPFMSCMFFRNEMIKQGGSYYNKTHILLTIIKPITWKVTMKATHADTWARWLVTHGFSWFILFVFWSCNTAFNWPVLSRNFVKFSKTEKFHDITSVKWTTTSFISKLNVVLVSLYTPQYLVLKRKPKWKI